MPMNFGGGLAGAGSGALLGSAFGPFGAAAGGLLGGLGGLFSGNKDKVRQINQLTPEQQQFQQNIFGQLGQMGGAGGAYGQAQNYLSNILSGSPEAFERFAAPMRTEFEQQTIPRLSERFASIGGGLGGGAGSSSGFAQALGGAGAQFQSNLSNLYAQLQQAAADRAFGNYQTLAQLGLGTRAFEPAYQPGNLGFGGELAGGLAKGVGGGIGMGLGERLAGIMASRRQDQGNQKRSGID